MKTQPSTDTIWAHLSTELRQFIRRRVSDDHAADDLLQETFLRIHRNLESLQDSDRLAGWVHKIARSVIHDYHRQSAKWTVALADEPVDECNDGLSQPFCQSACWLEEMVRLLPEGYQQAVQLAEINGLTQQTVADQLGITLSGAKSRVQRGRTLLREVLDQCCSFQFDHAGRLIDCDPRPNRKACRNCGEA